ncbi:tail fiber assembly protein [Enterobacter roggenkampii]|uniref:tail fiber assembly protein n=1 Tax=Enterobacter roggenkampii TaxID=1812935 RepID=UPI002A7F31ED|nr:tail fiber assembly protein [Enterobacter roggenkampii]
MPDKEYWAVTETSYRAVSGPESLVEGEILVEGERPVIPYLDNLSVQQEQRTKADAIIESLQEAVDVDLASDDEKARLLAWKRYRVLLSRVDLRAAKLGWPTLPD